MSEVESVPPVAGDEPPTKETFDMLKRQLDAMQAENAKHRARDEREEQLNLAYATSVKDMLVDHVTTTIAATPEHRKHIVEPMVTWAQGIDKLRGPELEKAIPLAQYIEVASAMPTKRSREQSDLTEEKDRELRETLQKGDEMSAENVKLRKQVSEITALLEEKMAAADRMATQIASYQGRVRGGDFRLAASRERSAAAAASQPSIPQTMTTGGAAAEPAISNALLGQTTEVASAGAAQPAAVASTTPSLEVAEWINTISPPTHSTKIFPTSSAHALLGSAGDGPSDEMRTNMSAVRAVAGVGAV